MKIGVNERHMKMLSHVSALACQDVISQPDTGEQPSQSLLLLLHYSTYSTFTTVQHIIPCVSSLVKKCGKAAGVDHGTHLRTTCAALI